MKTFTLSLVTCFISIFVSFTPKTGSSINEEALKKVQAYKQQNAIACGTGVNHTTGYLLSYFANKPVWNFIAAPRTSHNTLFIPDTLDGTNFTLRMHDTTKQFLNGFITNTSSFNNNDLLGPTLIFHKGSTVQMHVKNDLQDTTTVHWHGMHLPAIMDGGPHQVILPGVTWDPTWVVKNEAATYWYHPHLHRKTSQQLVQGLSGLIIVKDEKESALALPRIYGVDDIPLILNDKRFEAVTNQFEISRYGDTMTCNGTLNAEYNIPAQVVRFRLLNAAPERCYNLGLSNNQSFFVIASDAGLLSKPVAVKRYILAPGERIEILVNFSSLQNQSVELRAFNASLPAAIAGSEPDNNSIAKVLRNKLGRRDFDILKLNITTQTANAVTTIPNTLVQNETIDSTQATVTRTIKISQAGNACADPGTKCAWFNKQFFEMNRIDYKVKQDDTENMGDNKQWNCCTSVSYTRCIF
jgi:bilirubin oxidase